MLKLSECQQEEFSFPGSEPSHANVAKGDPNAISLDFATLMFSIYESFEMVESKCAAWDGCARETGGGLYVSFDWCRIWWDCFGSGRELRLFVFRRGENIVGVLPIFIERVWLGPVWIKVAKMVGADFVPAVCRLALPAEDAAEVIQQALRHLVVVDHCDAVVLGPLAGDDPHASAVEEGCRTLQGLLSLESSASPAPHTTFHLPATFDDYLSGLNKRQKQNHRRDLNLFNKSFRLEADVVREPGAAAQEFARFKQMHAAQWKADGKLGHFGDWPNSEKFNDVLVAALAPQGQVRLSRILADGQVVSLQYALTFGDWYYWRLPARAAEAQWDKFGLGRLGLFKMIEQAIGEGVRHIEGGPGHYEYKVQLGATEQPLRTMVVVAHRASARLRLGLFRHAAKLLHLLYYRIWFSRIAPRLPLPRRPLWKCWIRSRF